MISFMRLQGASFNQKVALAIFFPIIIFYLFKYIFDLILESSRENATKGSIFPFFLIGLKRMLCGWVGSPAPIRKRKMYPKEKKVLNSTFIFYSKSIRKLNSTSFPTSVFNNRLRTGLALVTVKSKSP